MTELTQYFTLSILPSDNTINISTNTLPNTGDIINVYVYYYKDRYKQNLVGNLSLSSNQSGSIVLQDDNIYRIVVELTCSQQDCGIIREYYDTWEYVYRLNGNVFNFVLTELIKWLCKCDTCPDHPQTKCLQCKDDNECHNRFIFDSSVDLLLSTILNYDESRYWTKFSSYTSADRYNRIVKDIYDAYNKGFVRGQYAMTESTVEYYWLLVYAYLLMRYSFYSGTPLSCIDNISSCIDSRFEYNKVLQCADAKGYDLYKMLNDYADIIDMGYIGMINDNLCNDIDECDYIVNLINSNEFSYSRIDVNERYINLEATSEPSKILILYPATWGNLINVDGDNIVNLTDEFDKYKVGNYFAWVSKSTYYDTDLNLKLSFKI